jgi:hypothetical protein
MDVILDANAYLGVLYNRGGEIFLTNRFAELLTYLRRVNSRLVIPVLTYAEVLERYREKLQTVSANAEKAWGTLQGYKSVVVSTLCDPL